MNFQFHEWGKELTVLLIDSVIFVLEFKVGEKEFTSYAIDQVMDYALDLKNFHETSHEQLYCAYFNCNKSKGTHTQHISHYPTQR